MIWHKTLESPTLHRYIRRRSIQFAGNARLKIYGRLNCSSGKRMRRSNRVFFRDEAEAIQQGFRPCGHCMSRAYKQWKSRNA